MKKKKKKKGIMTNCKNFKAVFFRCPDILMKMIKDLLDIANENLSIMKINNIPLSDIPLYFHKEIDPCNEFTLDLNDNSQIILRLVTEKDEDEEIITNILIARVKQDVNEQEDEK